MTKTLKLAVASLALGLTNAEYEACSRPKGSWVALDQGNGRSYAYAVAHLGNFVYSAGTANGNLTFTSNHITNGASGEITNHADVPIAHNTHTYTGGRYTNPASSQLGMDGIIYKISDAGVPAAVFAIDSYTSDGIYPGENGNYGNYINVASMSTFEAASDTTSLVVGGCFRGNLSFPTTSTGSGSADAETILTNRKSGSWDGWFAKINTDTMAAIWATPVNTPEGRNYLRAVATTASGHVVIAGEKRPSSDYIGYAGVYNGDTGVQTFFSDYAGTRAPYALETIGDNIFMGGRVAGSAINPFGTGAITTAREGATSENYITKMSSAGVGAWTVTFGSGQMRGIAKSPDGTHIYAVGSNSGAATIGTCSLTGTYGGYLIKLLAADGSCVWAKDTASTRKVQADATHVYTSMGDDEAVTYGAGVTVSSRGPEYDMMIAKYLASDGTGQWATSVGGSGDEYLYDMKLSSTGLAVSGISNSASFDMPGVTINNLQHARSGSTSANGGQRAAVIAMFDLTGQVPTCLSGCTTTTSASGVTVASGQCYNGGICYATGATDTFRACFSCNAATSQTVMQGPDTTNHCYIGGSCFPTGAMAPAYQRYNQQSVCETCNPTVNPNGYSLVTGYIHDRDITRTEPGRQGRRLSSPNAFGMIFAGSSNGCQTLPGLEMPASPSAALTAALAAHTTAATIVSGTIAASVTSAATISTSATAGILATIGRAVNATGEFAGVGSGQRKDAIDILVTDAIPIAAGRGGFSNVALADWQVLWAYYEGNPATCTKVPQLNANRGTAPGNLLCANTPSATAEAHAAIFGTSLHYGNAIAVVKTKQAMALGAANAEATTPDTDNALAFQQDTDMHMMIPYYQGVLKYAIDMDQRSGSNSRKTSQLKAYAYFSIIEAELLSTGDAEAMALATMLNPLSTPAGGTNDTFCAAKNLFMNHMPNASMFQYSQGTSSSATPTVSTVTDAVSFNFEEDIGTMPNGAGSIVCPAFSAPSLPTATHFATITVTAAGAVADYTQTVKDAMKIQIAAAMGVPAGRITITVEAGSVIITIQIGYTSAAAAEAGQTSINDLTSTAAATAAFLSTPAMTVTVTAVTAGSAGSSTGGMSSGALIGIIAGCCVAGLLLLGVICISMQRKKEGKPIFVCLDESGKKDKGNAGNA